MQLLIIRTNHFRTVFIFLIPLTLSMFTHLWNPLGFPSLYFDEGIYMRRAMHILDGQGAQEESTFYDHPYFGQLFLADVLGIIGYPHSLISLSATTNLEHVVKTLYLVPRILMGVLAVIDTFLIYKISESLYTRKTALVASVLFGVMPSTLIVRWILLDTIQLTLVLLSIVFAISRPIIRIDNDDKSQTRGTVNVVRILLSGVFLGLAIFTKIPAFTMIPLVIYLLYRTNFNKGPRTLLGLWLIPVLIIPLIWPAYSISINKFNFWMDGIVWQVHRESQPLFHALQIFFKNDPILFILGIAGLAYATVVKKDLLLLLWTIPYMIFLHFIGFVSLYHLIPLLPILCIAAALLIENLSDRVNNIRGRESLLVPFIVVSGIGIVGLINTVAVVSSDVNSNYFKATAFIVSYLQNLDHTAISSNHSKITVIADALYLWVPQYIFHSDHNFKIYFDKTPIKTQKVILIVDQGLLNSMSRNDEAAKHIQDIYYSHLIKKENLALFEKGQVSIIQYELR